MIKEFIKTNNLSFEEGQRNSNLVVVTGYTQFADLNKDDLEKALSKEIKKDKFIQEEIDRLWSYCKTNNYYAWWKTKEAHKAWKF